MKPKKKGILTLSIVIVALAVSAVLFSPLIKDGFDSAAVNRITAADLGSADSIRLIADCSTIDAVTDSVAGVKEAVRLGADGVIVDICFTPDNIPIMSDEYLPDKTSPTLESLFDALQDERYSDVNVYLNIVQLSDLAVLNELAVKYDISSRLYLIGIDSDHYGMITSDDTIIPFYLDYTLSDEDINSIKEGTFTVPPILDEYGAHGIIITSQQAAEKYVTALNDYGVPFLVKKAENGKKLCEILLNGATDVIVDDIDNSAQILDGWITAMQERFESSVQQSLKELSRTHKQNNGK